MIATVRVMSTAQHSSHTNVRTTLLCSHTHTYAHILLQVIADIRKNYITDAKFTPEAAEKASKAAAGLCKWVYALETYDRVAKEVAPKKEALRVAEEQLEV
jgi:Microtubule-binding stalk of dynein motor